ncbi:MAG TPA: hypothetical protein VID73_01630 [Ktedonobacterales bacterium]|jgi:hypothetical protein
MSEDIHLPPTSVGFPFTHDVLVAVFDERAPAERALDALRGSGFADEAAVLLPPERVSGELHERDARRTPLQRAAASVRESLEEESADAEDVAAEADAGHWIMRVHAPEWRQRDQAEAILKRHGAHDMTFYGQWTREELR